MSDDEWSKIFQQWVYVQRVKSEAQEAILEKTFRKVLVEVVNDVFKALNSKKT